jgi:hypothetical protein
VKCVDARQSVCSKIKEEEEAGANNDNPGSCGVLHTLYLHVSDGWASSTLLASLLPLETAHLGAVIEKMV